MKIEEQIAQVEKANGISFFKRNEFVSLMNREAQLSGDGKTWRTSTGRTISDIGEYILSRAEAGKYLSVKPSVKNQYAPKYKLRSEAVKAKHQSLVAGHVQKLIQHHRLIFKPGAEQKAIELISRNFLISDGPDGPLFQRVSDTNIGTLPGKGLFDFDVLLGNLGINLWFDTDATDIAQRQYKASLRQKATELSEGGSKSEINRISEQLAAFDRRNIRTGLKPLAFTEQSFEEEFRNFHSLSDPSMAVSRSRADLSALSSITDVQFAARKIELPKDDPKDYDFD